MAIQDKAVTVIGSDARVIALQIAPQPNGKIAVSVAGMSKDSAGNDVGLSQFNVLLDPGQLAAVDNVLARALIELRKANGLET